MLGSHTVVGCLQNSPIHRVYTFCCRHESKSARILGSADYFNIRLMKFTSIDALFHYILRTAQDFDQFMFMLNNCPEFSPSS